MTLHELHHCSIRTDKLEETKNFFVTALGMEPGDRPDFPFPGYWLYAEGEPMVHLVGIDPDNPEGLIQYLGDAAMDGPTGAFDHMAFNISEPSPLRKHLKKKKIAFREREVPNMGLQQFFLEDPNGVTVELNYWATTATPEIGAQPSHREILLGKAREMNADLRARSAQAEKRHRVQNQTIRDFEESGLMGIVQPARVGGSELDYAALLDATLELSRGCGSAGWIYINIACHHWMLAMFDKQAQDDVWKTGADTYVATSVIYPAGRAKKVKGGYTLSGRWPFCSGIHHSDWIIFGGMVAGRTKAAPQERRMFLLPKSDIEVIDTWDVTGLAATGSLDSAVSNVFIPVHRTLAAIDVCGGPTPGSAVNPNPLYQLPVAALFPHLIAAPVTGMAMAINDTCQQSMSARVSTYSQSKVADFPTLQLHLSDAMAACEASRSLIMADCEEAQRYAEAGKVAPLEAKTRWRRNAAFLANMAADATTQLYRCQGGGAIYAKNPLQRQFRDLHAGLGHIGVSNDANGVAYGRVALGLDTDNPLV